MDLLAQLLLTTFPTSVAGRLMLSLCLLGPSAGAALYARAAFGRWTWWSLGAGALAYNAIFFMGFMNFLLGLSVALCGAALWRILRRRGSKIIAALSGALVCLLAFFCHLFGFLFLALLITAQEADELLGLMREGRLTTRRLLNAVLILVTALGPAAMLYVGTHRAIARGDVLVWRWRGKIAEWVTPFMTYNVAATIGTAAVILVAVIVARKAAMWATGVGFALAALAVLYLTAPFAAAGGTFVDTRFPLMAALLVFAGMAPRLTPRASFAIGGAMALVIAGRSALTAVNWLGHGRDLVEFRSELALLPPGSIILPARTPLPNASTEWNARLLPNFSRLDDHLAALAVIERSAFYPLLFADPSQQPMEIRPPYASLSQPLGWPADWNSLFTYPPQPAALREFPYLADWRDRFDYVVLIGPNQTPDRTPVGLVLIRAGSNASLYAVKKRERDVDRLSN